MQCRDMLFLMHEDAYITERQNTQSRKPTHYTPAGYMQTALQLIYLHLHWYNKNIYVIHILFILYRTSSGDAF